MSYAAIAITRHSDAPKPPDVERCYCGAWCGDGEIWTCQHRDEKTGRLCLRRCCVMCQNAGAGWHLEACDDHIQEQARRQNQIIERYLSALLHLAVTGDQVTKDVCVAAMDLSTLTGEPERPVQLLLDLIRNYECADCGHPAMGHKCFDTCECQHEPGDRDGVADPPCMCKAPNDPLVQRIVAWLIGRRRHA